MNNVEYVESVIAECVRAGVKEFCVCAGSRNSPIVALLGASVDLRVHFFFDESSAAFFALGRSKQLMAPVGVVTTSGTAVAELLPATVEAHYSGVPLFLLTADRPRSYRGTGAPQSIEQVGIFSHYVENCCDLAIGEDFSLRQWSRKRPFHLNLCLAEPLLETTNLPNREFLNLGSHSQPNSASDSEAAIERAADAIQKSLNSSKRPLVILSGLSPQARPGVQSFLSKLGAPVYAEAVSGLREDEALKPWILRAGERMLSRGAFDFVLRIGGVPTLRFWRDLDEKFSQIPVVSLDDKNFSGLSHGTHLCAPVSDVMQVLLSRGAFPKFEVASTFRAQDQKFYEARMSLLADESQSEVSLVHRLSRQIPRESRVFLGNSMPIREWDLAADHSPRHFEIGANRGANGIDGEVSTFFGWADTRLDNWALLGDFTALYDLSAPWILRQIEDLSFALVVIHNGGGQIFSRLPSLRKLPDSLRLEAFVQHHNVSFEGWAKMWNLGFETWDHIPSSGPGSDQSIIELRPDLPSSERFWKKYEALWEQHS